MKQLYLLRKDWLFFYQSTYGPKNAFYALTRETSLFAFGGKTTQPYVSGRYSARRSCWTYSSCNCHTAYQSVLHLRGERARTVNHIVHPLALDHNSDFTYAARERRKLLDFTCALSFCIFSLRRVYNSAIPKLHFLIHGKNPACSILQVSWRLQAHLCFLDVIITDIGD